MCILSFKAIETSGSIAQPIHIYANSWNRKCAQALSMSLHLHSHFILVMFACCSCCPQSAYTQTPRYQPAAAIVSSHFTYVLRIRIYSCFESGGILWALSSLLSLLLLIFGSSVFSIQAICPWLCVRTPHRTLLSKRKKIIYIVYYPLCFISFSSSSFLCHRKMN